MKTRRHEPLALAVTAALLNLPTSSEGLGIPEDHACMIVDGDEGDGDEDGVCEKSSRRCRVELP